MGDPKRGKPQDRKDDETSPDRVRPPGLPGISAPSFGQKQAPALPEASATPGLPAITAPSFGQKAAPALPEVSVTSPATDIGPEERTRTVTDLDPAAYAATGDKDPDELASEFQPLSGKQLDAGGRLIAPVAASPPPEAPPARQLRPEPEPAPLPPEDLPPTKVAVPSKVRSSRRSAPLPPPGPSGPKAAAQREPPAARAAAQRPEPAPPPPGPEDPTDPKGSVQRPEPGRWILNKEGLFSPEAGAGEEQGAFDPTVRRAAPVPIWRRIPRRAALAAMAVVLVLAIGAGALVLRSRSGPAPGTDAPPPPQSPGLQLRITSKPSNAAVRINGVLVGTTPLERESPFAPEAELEVEVVLKGYRPWSKRFRAGQNVSAHAVLKPGR